MIIAESALVVLVPEAEALVKPFRDAHDPSAAVDVPAHVTILCPFLAPDAIDEAVLTALRGCLVVLSSFNFTLAERRRFPGVLYLAPTDPEPFRVLTRAVWKRYPETPPYGGRHAEISPHLTIAQIADEERLTRVAAEFEAVATDALPIRSRVREIALLENRTGRWRQRVALPLGAG